MAESKLRVMQRQRGILSLSTRRLSGARQLTRHRIYPCSGHVMQSFLKWNATVRVQVYGGSQSGSVDLSVSVLDPSTTAMRIAATVLLVASTPLGALAAPNPIFASLRSLVREASALTGFDLGLVSDAVQHIVKEQQQHVKQWIHDGREMIEQAGVVCKFALRRSNRMDVDEPATSARPSSFR